MTRPNHPSKVKLTTAQANNLPKHMRPIVLNLCLAAGAIAATSYLVLDPVRDARYFVGFAMGFLTIMLFSERAGMWADKSLKLYTVDTWGTGSPGVWEDPSNPGDAIMVYPLPMAGSYKVLTRLNSGFTGEVIIPPKDLKLLADALATGEAEGMAPRDDKATRDIREWLDVQRYLNVP